MTSIIVYVDVANDIYSIYSKILRNELNIGWHYL